MGVCGKVDSRGSVEADILLTIQGLVSSEDKFERNLIMLAMC